MHRLDRDFFNRPTLTVASDLLGKEIFYKGKTGIITETEAYIGEDDPACHAFHGRTKRTQTMYMDGGTAYVYFIYGMYHCLNFVTERIDFPSAVLIRAVKTDTLCKTATNGPAKLCRYFGITTKDDKTDVVTCSDFFIKETNQRFSFVTTPRIGIKQGKDRLWRFLAEEN